MVLALILLIVWPLAELYVVVQVAQAIGVLLTLLLLIATWPLGRWVLRSQGRAAWSRLTAAVVEGRPPAREVVDGGLVLVGGMLLMIPGFITDAIALAFLVAPGRALTRSLLLRNFHSRPVVQAARFAGRPYDVDSTARDIDQPRLRP